ncbi:MAG: uracil-DNA glycosylase [Cypionkella sp.]
MGIETDIANDWHAALAALAWQVDLGVSDIIAETPLDRYDLPAPVKLPDPVALPAKTQTPRAAPDAAPSDEAILAAATSAAAQAQSLDDLREALARFDHCDFKRGARNLVFADGNPQARVLILGEAPGVEEDREGRPFVGRAGEMLDRMFAAIGLSRQSPDPATALYLTNVLPWRPPNRDPSPAEIAMMRPFVARHIELINPDVVVVLGNTSLQAALDTTGILRHRGIWAQAFGRPVLPMAHPAYLMRVPEAKRDAWADLLALQSKLRQP